MRAVTCRAVPCRVEWSAGSVCIGAVACAQILPTTELFKWTYCINKIRSPFNVFTATAVTILSCK